MVKIKVILYLVIVTCLPAYAQVNRYAVFFKDKQNSAFSISNPLAYLSQRSIDRRAKNNIQINETDLPVNESYVNQIKNAGATILARSKWFNAVVIECDEPQIADINKLGVVWKSERIAPGATPPVFARQSGNAKNRKTGNTTAKTNTQLNMIGIDVMHNQNYHGEGVKIAIFDSGFLGVNTTEPFELVRPNILGGYNFTNRIANVYTNDDHGTHVLSIMAGFVDNVFVGGAYKAEYYLYVTEHVSDEFRVEEYNWLLAAEQADSIGVDVINSSLGYNLFDDTSMNYYKDKLDGKTAAVTRAAQFASDKGIFVVVSAGNEGANFWQLVTPPADASGVLAAGSINVYKRRSSFSSIGPTTDGRVKPDLVALGSSTYLVRSDGSVDVGDGTSYSSPLLASLVAGLVQAYPTKTKAELTNALLQSASNATNPNIQIGYGIPGFVAVSNFLDATVQEEAFIVYPNPVEKNMVYVKPKDIKDHPQISIELVDTHGAHLKSYTYTADWAMNKAEIDLSDLPAGVLFMRISTLNRSDIFKIVNLR